MRISTRRHAARLFAVNEGPNRLPVAIKAAFTIALPLSIALLLGHPELGLLCGPGAFTVLYGPATPARFRIKLMSAAGVGFLVAGTLGSVTAWSPTLALVAMLGVAVVATLLCAALEVGPPGPYFFALVVGVSGSMTAHGVPATTVIGGIAVGVATAIAVGMSDLVGNPRGPERDAITAADRAITAYERTSPIPSEVGDARARASAALHAAWTALTDGSGRSHLSPGRHTLAAPLVALHQRYVTTTGHLAGASVARPAVDDPDRVVPSTIDLEQLRDTSLGRPRSGYLLRGALTWPSESLVVAIRVVVAGLVSGLVAMAFDVGHAYWATAFGVLVLANVGTRHSQLFKAAQRFVGTVIGLAVFLGLTLIAPTGWWLVAVLTLLQFSVEFLIVRNYAYAVALITPLALTMATSGADHPDPTGFVRDRVLDTVIGVGVAVVVALLVGRRTPALLVPEYGRRTLRAIGRVTADLAEGSWASVAARENRRHLSFELLANADAVTRAQTDDPARVEPYLHVWNEIADLGYFVLGACWHPELRDNPAWFGAAKAILDPVLDTVSAASAASLSRDLASFRRALAAGASGSTPPSGAPDNW